MDEIRTENVNAAIDGFVEEINNLQSEVVALRKAMDEMKQGQFKQYCSSMTNEQMDKNAEELAYLQSITADIPLDRLKEICEAVRLIGQECYVVEKSGAIKHTITDIGIEHDDIEINIMCFDDGVGGGISYSTFTRDKDIFYGDNARERAEQRLCELKGERE